jgi:transposase
MPAGRPTKYKPEIAETLPDQFKDGQSVIEVCVQLGISKDTFYAWVKEYPEFSDSYKKGLEYSQQWWEKLGRAGTVGKIPVNPTMWIFNMKNRFRADWADRQEITGSNGAPLEISLIKRVIVDP